VVIPTKEQVKSIIVQLKAHILELEEELELTKKQLEYHKGMLNVLNQMEKKDG